ncbi:MAG: hypothetical protein KIT83_00180 [Bryobacterales bacterium]|nr:hypothetical protein [Bryobacterales bacterium]
MRVKTFFDLGLPSIGRISLQEMGEHRNPMVVALARFLAEKAKYLPEDTFDVEYLLHLAGFVEPMGGGKRFDFTKIRIGSAGGNAVQSSRGFSTTSSAQSNPWQVVFVRERTRAVEALAVRKLGLHEGKKLLPQLLSRGHHFGME